MSPRVSAAQELIPIDVAAASIVAAIAKVRRSGTIRHILVTRTDGLSIAHDLPDATQAKRVAAMAAAIIGTGEMATNTLEIGRLREATVDADAGQVVCLRAGAHAIVAGMTKGDANVGLVLMVLRELAQVVEQTLGDRTPHGNEVPGLGTNPNDLSPQSPESLRRLL